MLRIIFFLALTAIGLAAPAQAKDAPSPHVDLIVIDGSINPAVDDFIRESIARAKANGARALIIQMDTPGGLLNSTRTIVKEMLGAQVPVMVYVAPAGAGAGSAGVFITMAAHVAAMAPGTNIGAAHPVAGGGQEVKGVMGEKIENFTASFSESIAQKRGRNTKWAIEAVRKSVAITEKEALKINVIDIVARDIEDLLTQADGRLVDIDGHKQELALKGARVARHEMSLKQRVLNAIADPNIAYLLMMAGILGLYMEFSHPGVFFPGVAGAICLLLAFASLQVLPINYTGLALMLLGVALPAVLLAHPWVRRHPNALLGAGILAVSGLVFNRVNIALTSMWEAAGRTYVPSWMEFAVTAGIAALAVLAFKMVATYLPVFEAEEVPEAERRPAPVSHPARAPVPALVPAPVLRIVHAPAPLPTAALSPGRGSMPGLAQLSSRTAAPASTNGRARSITVAAGPQGRRTVRSEIGAGLRALIWRLGAGAVDPARGHPLGR